MAQQGILENTGIKASTRIIACESPLHINIADLLVAEGCFPTKTSGWEVLNADEIPKDGIGIMVNSKGSQKPSAKSGRTLISSLLGIFQIFARVQYDLVGLLWHSSQEHGANAHLWVLELYGHRHSELATELANIFELKFGVKVEVRRVSEHEKLASRYTDECP